MRRNREIIFLWDILNRRWLPATPAAALRNLGQEFPAFTQYEVRSALAKCGLTTKHIESQVRVLSGGEQAKVRLCKLINRETNSLLLDEPTNHLDVDAKEELKRALKEISGEHSSYLS